MIVPFIIDYWEYNTYPKWLCIAYKFLNYCKENNVPIIGQHKYFENPDLYRETNFAFDEACMKIHDYTVPTVDDINSVDKYVITEEQEQKILKKYKNTDEAMMGMHKKLDKDLYEVLTEYVDEIENKNSITAIVSWDYNFTMHKICEEKGIKFINLELTTMRVPIYNTTLCYFSSNKYDYPKINNDYEEFIKNKGATVLFSRKELLALFLSTDYIDNIKYLYYIPKYELGYAMGVPNDLYEKTYSNYNEKKIIDRMGYLYDEKEISVRPHPMNKEAKFDKNYNLDNSKITSKWISLCKRIICNVSNIGYEGMLYGRSITHISPSLPSAFNDVSDLSYINDEVVGIDKLNFLTFYCYTPRELCFDIDYIKWRLTNPSVIDIYNKNLEFVLNKHKLNIKQLKNGDYNYRLTTILKKVHKLDKNKIDEVLNYGYKDLYDELVNEKIVAIEEKEKMQQQYEIMMADYNSIINSKSWKITKPLRYITNKIKKHK